MSKSKQDHEKVAVSREGVIEEGDQIVLRDKKELIVGKRSIG
jgi:hypothetical protein